MGRGFLIFVAAAVLGGGALLQSSLTSSRERDETIVDHEFDILARQIALSAMNLGVAEAKINLSSVPSMLYQDVPFQQGFYDLTGSLLATGDMKLHSIGKIGGAVYHICSAVNDGEGGPIESALIVETNAAAVDFRGNSFLISGLDTDPPSMGGLPPFNGGPTPGDGSPVHAIGVPSSGVETIFESEPSSQQEDNIVGMDGSLDVYSGPQTFDVDAFYAETLTKVDSTLGSGIYNGNMVWGAPDDMTVVRITGDAVINGNLTGFGVLLIEGDITLGAGDFMWEGIVMVYSPAGEDLNVTLSGGVEIYGALILKNDGGNNDDLNFDLDLTQTGTAAISYSSETIDKLAVEFTTIQVNSPMKTRVISQRESKYGC